MSCSVCSASVVVSAGLCAGCSSLVVKADAVPTAPVQWKGSNRSNVRDRQWTYKHATEALVNPNVTVEDLISLRDRVPNDSKRGQVMRRKLNERIREIRTQPKIGDLHRPY